MSNTIIGLDVSTSIVGIAIVDASKEFDGANITLLDAIVFGSKHVDLIDKAEAVASYLRSIVTTVPMIAIEEPLMSFSPGFSSAKTISTLMSFNGMVSLLAFQVFAVKPVHLSASHSRKLCGMKMQQRKKCGKSHKEQVFDHMMANDLKSYSWPTKQSGKKKGSIVDWSRDATDAYVIARAAHLSR